MYSGFNEKGEPQVGKPHFSVNRYHSREINGEMVRIKVGDIIPHKQGKIEICAILGNFDCLPGGKGVVEFWACWHHEVLQPV